MSGGMIAFNFCGLPVVMYFWIGRSHLCIVWQCFEIFMYKHQICWKLILIN